MYCKALGFIPVFAILVQNVCLMMWGLHYRRQRLLVTLVKSLGEALKHGVIVDGHFR